MLSQCLPSGVGVNPLQHYLNTTPTAVTLLFPS